ncbi:MAG: hypothetical protein R6V44_06040 [Paracoccaceae bacterium]
MFELIGSQPAIGRRFAPGSEPDFWARAGLRFAEILTGEQAAALLFAGLLAVLVISTVRVRSDLRRRRIARVDAARRRGHEAARRRSREAKALATLRRAQVAGRDRPAGRVPGRASLAAFRQDDRSGA